MKQLTDISLAKDALLAGSLIVAKTDTIYGILARAVDPDAVSKLYLAKNRNPQKSCIILVSDIDHIPGDYPLVTRTTIWTYSGNDQQL